MQAIILLQKDGVTNHIFGSNDSEASMRKSIAYYDLTDSDLREALSILQQLQRRVATLHSRSLVKAAKESSQKSESIESITQVEKELESCYCRSSAKCMHHLPGGKLYGKGK